MVPDDVETVEIYTYFENDKKKKRKRRHRKHPIGWGLTTL
jgi:hypothetical protein